MRREDLYLADMLEACRAVARFIADMDEAAFQESELHQAAVLQKLTVIGEAASRLSSELQASHPQIDWRAITGFRNIAVHAYFSVDWSIVWATAIYDLPPLQKDLETILEAQGTDAQH